MISDWSGFALEFHLVTQKNIIFINTPPKVKNNQFEELSINPIEETIRSDIGKIISIDNIYDINRIIKEILKSQNKIKEKQKLIYDYYKNIDHVLNKLKTLL